MIRNFSDHAANERTFLAWTRTGLAVIAFGFVIEKFNLFVETIATTATPEMAHHLTSRLAGPLARYDGIALVLVGIAILVIAGIRYAHTAQLINAEDYRSLGGVRFELALTILLTVLAMGFCLFAVFA